jgi:hypothetical protein
MGVGDVSRHDTIVVGTDRHSIALLHDDDLPRTYRHRSPLVGNSDLFHEDHHGVVNSADLLQDLVWPVAPEADGYRPHGAGRGDCR